MKFLMEEGERNDSRKSGNMALTPYISWTYKKEKPEADLPDAGMEGLGFRLSGVLLLTLYILRPVEFSTVRRITGSFKRIRVWLLWSADFFLLFLTLALN